MGSAEVQGKRHLLSLIMVRQKPKANDGQSTESGFL